jgi:hypothetical protein
MDKHLCLSWDVGIKNLAYCLIYKENENFEIKKWGTINLGEEINLCSHYLCNKEAKFFTEKTYFCNRHSKYYKPTPVTIVQIMNKNKTCVYVIKGEKKCGKKATGMINNVEYCNSHVKIQKKTIENSLLLKKITKTNSNKIPMITIAQKLFTSLDKTKEFLEVNEILIENQPTLKNPTMKTVSSLLFSYFIMKGIVEKEKNNSKIDNVRFICPSNKLKVGLNSEKKIKEVVNTSDNDESKIKAKCYKLTKELGKKFCKELIKNDKKNLEFLNSQKKQDDLCDSFLQAYSYLFCKPFVPKHIAEILDKIVDNIGNDNIENTKKNNLISFTKDDMNDISKGYSIK